jgi:hypothetical protein
MFCNNKEIVKAIREVFNKETGYLSIPRNRVKPGEMPHRLQIAVTQ